MVATHQPIDCSDSALGEDLLAEVADLRARGQSWEEVAAHVQWDAGELRRALRDDPAFGRALERARREADDEAEADGLRRLRALARDDNLKIALAAADIILRHVAAKRRDQTRLEVERLRAGRAAKGGVSEEGEEGGEKPEPEESPERRRLLDEGRRRLQADYADDWARGVAAVYLWGGCHKLGVPPDKTDTPLLLFRDHAVSGPGVSWATTATPPVPDGDNGPFLPPPGFRPVCDAPPG